MVLVAAKRVIAHHHIALIVHGFGFRFGIARRKKYSGSGEKNDNSSHLFRGHCESVPSNRRDDYVTLVASPGAADSCIVWIWLVLN